MAGSRAMKHLGEERSGLPASDGDGRDAAIRALETERDLLRERLARAEAEASAAAASRDAFLATASHELRNAVATLVLSLGAIERALATGGNEARIAKNLDSSKRSVALLRGLLDDMQDGARFRAGPVELSPGPADLAAIARAVVQATAAKAQRAGVTVTLEAPDPVPGIWDAPRLDRALFHLVQNALRHARGSPVEVTVAAVAAGARLTVRDQGPGIAPADHARIFEPFVRVGGTGDAGGLGLGLYIARRLVEAHGGTLSVESTPGDGARFTIELPLDPPTV